MSERKSEKRGRDRNGDMEKVIKTDFRERKGIG
jgi:hypothetical protein